MEASRTSADQGGTATEFAVPEFRVADQGGIATEIAASFAANIATTLAAADP